MIQPSWKTGFARNAAESANPELWRSLVGTWVPALGVQGGKLYDLSGNGNHGTLTNMDSATDWVLDENGNALNIDGPGEGVVKSSVNWFPKNLGTMLIGYKRKAAFTNSFSVIVNIENSGNNSSHEVQFNLNHSSYGWAYVPTKDASQRWEFSTLVPDLDKYYNMAVAWDRVAGNLRGWLNGVVAGTRRGSASWTENIWNSGEGFSLGGRAVSHPSTDYTCSGNVYYMYIFDRFLDDSTVLKLHLDPLAPLRQRTSKPMFVSPPPAGGGYPAAYYDAVHVQSNPGMM